MEQVYDILLRGGQIIDPVQGIFDVRDVGIYDGKIHTVDKDLDISGARKVIPMKGKLVTPGLIDMHCHPRPRSIVKAADPDQIGIYSGVTAICEGGESGAGNFYKNRKLVYEHTKTDMFCFLNLGITGFTGMPAPEIRDECDIDIERSKRVIEENRDIIKGIKLRAISSVAKGIGIKAVEMAKKLALDVKLPLVVHIGEGSRVPNDPLDSFSRALVKLMEKGDVLTHYLSSYAGGLILPDGTIYTELWEAQKRGVILDACHGFSHFSFPLAQYAIQQGLLPTVISTDLSPVSLNSVQSLMVTMSKFLNIGLTIEQVVEMTTNNPAKILGEETQRGSLKPGMPADLTIMEITKGNFIFTDGRLNNTLNGDTLLEPRLVIKRGVEIPCFSRYELPMLR
jgi:dihydroorotase